MGETKDGMTLISMEYTGPMVSMNDMIGKSWADYRKKDKKPAVANLSRLVLVEVGRDVKAAEFGVELRGNIRHDVDNRIALTKLFVDCLRAQEVVLGDEPKHYKFCSSVHDETLPKGTLIINFYYKPRK